jgi:NAD+ diphosphatase
MAYRFTSTPLPPEHLDQPALWFIYQGYQLLVENGAGKAEVPRLIYPAEIGVELNMQEYLGYLADDEELIHCFSGEVGPAFKPPDGMSFGNLRALFPLLAESEFWLAGRAVQIVDWDRTHQFCSRCGHKTINQIQDRSKLCPNCGFSSYPRLAPAIIVRVTKETGRGQQILLARAQRFPTGLFSVLAGFVEPGETLEECVAREIYEEVSLTVDNIRYFGSQPWPFPHSLMIAFTAEYVTGEIKADPAEIIEAGWYSPEQMPATPLPPSIANRLITTWLDENSSIPSHEK